jgi:hypothetical protein
VTASEAIALMTDEAERQCADADDSNGIIRSIVAANLPGRPDAQFYAWFSICIEISDRAARKAGFTSAVAMAYRTAEASRA